jgi:outer membrane lipoprotein-sorting protein
MRRALAALAFAAASAPACAAFDVAALMKLLGATEEVKASFVERKYSPLLVASIDSSGTLLYKRPDIVEKVVARPRAERYRILKDEVVVERGGKETRMALASQPALAGLAASLRGVLSGDAALLGRYFQLKVGGDENAWTLELVPSGNAIRAYVERIVASGRGGRVERIETFEAQGDRTVMEIS